MKVGKALLRTLVVVENFLVEIENLEPTLPSLSETGRTTTAVRVVSCASSWRMSEWAA